MPIGLLFKKTNLQFEMPSSFSYSLLTLSTYFLNLAKVLIGSSAEALNISKNFSVPVLFIE